MGVPFSPPTPTAWAELHLGRVLAHHSNFQKCLPAAIRYHKAEIAFRRQVEDKRSARVPPGLIHYAQGMTEIFAPDIQGRRVIHPDRFDGEGRRMITAMEIEKRTGCTVAECRRAAEFYKLHDILSIEHGQKLNRKGFWIRWSFEPERRSGPVF